MNRSLRTRFIASAAIALGAIGVASAAHARSDVYFSIGIQPAGVYSAPAYVERSPVYVAPAPVITAPPVYVAPPAYGEVYVQPGAYGEVYVQPGAYGYADRDEWRRRAEWRHRYWRHHHRDWDDHGWRGRD